MHSYEAWAGLLKFINDLCLYQVTLNHLIPRGHVELMLRPTVYLKKRQVHCVSPKFVTKPDEQNGFVLAVISTAYYNFSYDQLFV